MIPTEIDELMWTIAEGNDPHAVAEFGERYPNLREELLKRMKTVQAFKAAGSNVKTKKIPVFRSPNIQTVNLQLAYGAVCLALLVVGSFAIWRATHTSPVPATVPQVEVGNRKMPAVQVVPNNDAGMQGRQVRNSRTNKPETNRSNQEQQWINPPVVPSRDENGMPRTTISLESASLHAAITMIAEAGKMKVQIANGTPNPTVKVDLRDMTPMDMLKELGKQYAFDTIMDGEHAILIVPKKDDLDDSNNSQTR